MASFRSRYRSSNRSETSGGWSSATRLDLARVKVDLEMFEFPDLFL